MSALPVVVAWGGVISKVLVVGIAAGAVGAYQAMRKRRDLRPVREDVHRMSLSINEPREGAIAIRGTYRISGGERGLECSGERVVLDGDVRIVRGTGATWKSAVRSYTLRDGDMVVAIGQMTRRAGGDTSGYREAAGGWTLTPSVGETSIQVCSAKPVATPKPLWLVRGVVVLGLAGAAAFFGLGWIGMILVERREYPRKALVEEDGVSTLRAELASALPRSRARALARLQTDLMYKPQTEQVVQERIALAHLDGCLAESELLAELERYDTAIEVARACNHPEYTRRSLVELGRYDEAAQIPAAPTASDRDDRLAAAIGAGRWRDAEMIEEAATRDPGDDEAARCFALYLKSRMGVRIPTVEGSNATCRIVAGILAPEDERNDRFADEHDPNDLRLRTARWVLTGNATDEAGLDPDVASWLAPFAAIKDSAVARVLLGHRELALGNHDAAAGEFAKAKAARAPSDDEESRAFAAAVDQRLAHLVALRSGRPIAPFDVDPTNRSDVVEEAAAIRSGVPVREAAQTIRVYPEECREEVIGALADAVAGDGRPAARVFERCSEPVGLRFDTEYLLAVAPSVKMHQDELAAAIHNTQTAGMPFGHTNALALKRDLLRLLGDTAEATHLQEIIDRHAKAFADRDSAMAMFLAFER